MTATATSLFESRMRMPRASLLPLVASLIFSDTFIDMMRLDSERRLASSIGTSGASPSAPPGAPNSEMMSSAVGPSRGGGEAAAWGPKRRMRASSIAGTSSSIRPLRTAKSQTPSISAPAALGFFESERMMSSWRSRRSWFWPIVSAVRLLHPSATAATASSGVLPLRINISA